MVSDQWLVIRFSDGTSVARRGVEENSPPKLGDLFIGTLRTPRARISKSHCLHLREVSVSRGGIVYNPCLCSIDRIIVLWISCGQSSLLRNLLLRRRGRC